MLRFAGSVLLSLPKIFASSALKFATFAVKKRSLTAKVAEIS